MDGRDKVKDRDKVRDNRVSCLLTNSKDLEVNKGSYRSINNNNNCSSISSTSSSNSNSNSSSTSNTSSNSNTRDPSRQQLNSRNRRTRKGTNLSQRLSPRRSRPTVRPHPLTAPLRTVLKDLRTRQYPLLAVCTSPSNPLRDRPTSSDRHLNPVFSESMPTVSRPVRTRLHPPTSRSTVTVTHDERARECLIPMAELD